MLSLNPTFDVFSHSSQITPVARSVTLHQIKLDTYVIPGVKQLILHSKSINQERTNFTFSLTWRI